MEEPLPEGLVVVVRRSCPTCELIEPVLRQLRDGPGVTVVTQDVPDWPAGLAPVDDTDLRVSWGLQTETTPTLYRIQGGAAVAAAPGWHRQRWQDLAGVEDLGPDLPDSRAGCGSMIFEPGVRDALLRSSGHPELTSRRVEVGEGEDLQEAMYARGWSDGLPLVAPTPERVARMLEGTVRDPDEVVCIMPPDLVPCTVEKVAVNAVMAGCLPEHLGVVLAAVSGAASDSFNIHGLSATTYFSGPVLIVNGPVRERIGMNWGYNALGPGNRANATIGRALNLVVRNVGGARPGGVDRAALGSPGKLTFCFAEDEGGPWESLAVERGVPPGRSAVTLFAGHGPHEINDQRSRTPDSLARSFALQLRSVAHPKLARRYDAIVVVSPNHARVFEEAGWSKSRLGEAVRAHCTYPAEEMARGAGGVEEGLTDTEPGGRIEKFAPDGLWFVRAGGPSGLMSGIIGGWTNGPRGSQMTTVPIEE